MLNRSVQLFAIALVALLVGCVGARPVTPGATEELPQIGSLTRNPGGAASLSIRLVDKRRSTQAVADADSFNGVLFKLSNPMRLRQPIVVAAQRDPNNTYAATFPNIPADVMGHYTLTVGLYRNVDSPTNPADPSYTDLDDKVGEGATTSLVVAPGQSRSVALTINTVGHLTFDQAEENLDLVDPVFLSGDIGIVDVLTNLASDPGIASMSLYVLDLDGATISAPVQVANHEGPSVSATFSVPTLTGTTYTSAYSLVVDAIDPQGQLVSRRSRQFGVEQPATVATLLEPPPPSLTTDVFSAWGWDIAQVYVHDLRLDPIACSDDRYHVPNHFLIEGDNGYTHALGRDTWTVVNHLGYAAPEWWYNEGDWAAQGLTVISVRATYDDGAGVTGVGDVQATVSAPTFN